MEIRIAGREHLHGIIDLALLLWPDNVREELAIELEKALNDEGSAMLLATEGTTPLGFAHCQIRSDYVEGTRSSPAGYLEGIYVVEGHRHEGIAGKLLEACEDWARSKGITELASDCELSNETSIAFHERTGFREANRLVCFVKDIDR